MPEIGHGWALKPWLPVLGGVCVAESADDPYIGVTLRLSQWRALLARLTTTDPATPQDGVFWIDPTLPDFRSAEVIIRRLVQRHEDSES